jgi:hypothetical protein
VCTSGRACEWFLCLCVTIFDMVVNWIYSVIFDWTHHDFYRWLLLWKTFLISVGRFHIRFRSTWYLIVRDVFDFWSDISGTVGKYLVSYCDNAIDIWSGIYCVHIIYIDVWVCLTYVCHEYKISPFLEWAWTIFLACYYYERHYSFMYFFVLYVEKCMYGFAILWFALRCVYSECV